jgi:WD40 repeat protein/energy-coupling factor transporter ATP-binding protein EcfA2
MTPEGLTLSAEAAAPVNPFPGLRPFEFDESHLYFGRDGQSDQLIRKLSATRFVAVVGTSGSGKSSLVRAGLLPDLFGGYMTSAGSRWRVALMRPGNDPLGNLARALNDPAVFGSDIEENAQIQTAITEATLRRGGLGLVEAVAQNRMPSNENLLVLVDQFEELFRFARVSGSEQYRYEASAFVKLLLEAARRREHNIYVVLTMRSDFLGDCSMFWDLPEAINDGQYLIPRMTRDQRAEAITGPIAVCGGRIAQRLVNRLLNDTGDNPDLLPILQHALMRTWENWSDDHAAGEPLDLRHYEAVGTMSEALSRHADEAYHELPDERSRRLAEKVFKALTEKGEDNREVRRPTELGKLCALTGASAAEVTAVLEVFRREGRSFLTPSASVPLGEETPVDISHESLIRNWERLRAWVDEESLSAQIYRRLADTAVLYERAEAGLWRDPDLQLALDWRERSRPGAAWAARYHPAFDSAMAFLDASVAARDAAAREEESRRRREIRRTRLAAAFFFFLFMLSLVAFAFAYAKSIQAQEALDEARAARAQAETERDRANERSEFARSKEAKAQAAERVAEERRKEAEASKAEAEEQQAEALKQADIARQNERRAEAARREADEQRKSAVLAGEKNRLLLYAADINLAQQAYDASNIRRGRDLLMESLATADKSPLGPSDALRPETLERARPGFEWFYLWRLHHGETGDLVSHDKGVNGVAYSPDGRLLASVGSDGAVKLWDLASKVELASLPGHAKAAMALGFSPDGRTLATVGDDRAIKLWDVASGRELSPPFEAQEREVSCVAFSKDGRLLATGGRDGILRLWDVASRKLLKALEGHQSVINAVAFSPDGRLLATGSVDKDTRLWEIESGASHVLRNETTLSSVLSVAFSPDGRTLATGSNDKKVRFWEVASRSLVYEPDGHTGPVNSVRFSPDGRLLASGGSDKNVIIWPFDGRARAFEQKERVTLKGHVSDVRSVAFSPDGGTLASAGADRAIKLWDVASQLREHATLGHPSGVRTVAVAPDGKTVAAGSGRDVLLWGAATRRPLGILKGAEHAVWSVAFSPDGRTLAAGGQDNSVKFWDLASGERSLPDLVGHTKTVTAVAYSPDRRLLATAGRDATVRLWDAATRRELASLDGYTRPVLSLAFSSDGRMLATGGADTLVVWDVLKRTRLFSKTTPSVVNAVAFSPGGNLLAFAYGLRVGVWNAGTSAVEAELEDHAAEVRAVAFSPDGRTLATGGNDADVMLWDARSFKRLLTLKGHTNDVNAVAFSPDGGMLLTASSDQTVRAWRAATTGEVLAAR